MEKILPFLVIVIVIFVIVAIGYGVHVAEKKRTASLRDFAEKLGLPFFEQGDPALVEILGAFRLFSQGRGKKISNMLHGETEDVDMAIFDYRFTTGHGKQQRTTKQTVIYFDSRLLALPDFTLRPGHLFHLLGKMIGLHDIDFDDHPLFSKKFMLEGSNEQEIRERFRPEILDWFEKKLHLSAEGRGNRLLVYHAGRIISPENIQQLMTDGFELHALLRDSPTDMGSTPA